jgi:hypothetical protein
VTNEPEEDEPYERTIRVSYKFLRELLAYLDCTERFVDLECPGPHAVILYTPTGKKLMFVADKEQEGKTV